ncbi:putative thioredoxin-like protein [Trypanosoma vivax]|uniref:Putative thioredoxin-like protein n=1 Tax=Trypanosoma vivax (strain Y486) TaxID=1055687 RepID=G0TV79_TRYVY|nr:putative thioredoxin-like protein [Trypanosoma vivax]CCC47845.1 putative thioredoxin-like protein [Trypanosoma vivax Y486]
MRKVASTTDFDKLKGMTNYLGIVTHFSASWCEPCALVNEMLEAHAKKYEGSVLFVQVDTELLGELCNTECVDCVPFIAFYRRSEKGQERVAHVIGGKSDQIEQNIISLFGNGHDTQDSFPDIQSYLKYLTTRSGIVIFITGTPSMPRCGFTAKLITLLDELGANFLYYDVWASDEVCEGLKKFSEWPTYPQVYVDGEFIGGYDICVELKASGELKSVLKL